MDKRSILLLVTSGIIFFLAIIFFCASVTRQPKEKVVRIYHSYKPSRDYRRLKQLLDDGQQVVRIIDGDSKYSSATVIARRDHFDNSYYYMGLGNQLNIGEKGCSEDKFVAYCMFNDLEYLDFGDVVNQEETIIEDGK